MAMILVSLLALASTSSLDAELPHLAADLAITPYDARLLLAPGFPAIVLSTPDRDRALRLLAALRARGHEAAACQVSAIVASSSMISLRRFRFDDDSVVATDQPDARLPYDDILCLLPAWHRQGAVSETEVRERKFDAGRALVSGGLVMTKTTSHNITSKREAREEVLYIFRRSTHAPWILRESGTNYAPLGPARTHVQHENFLTTVSMLRERARGAAYDERLRSVKKVPEKVAMSVSGGTSTIATSSEAGMDMLAHLLALLFSRTVGSPYRE
jgi:hypothetical protein